MKWIGVRGEAFKIFTMDWDMICVFGVNIVFLGLNFDLYESLNNNPVLGYNQF